MSNLAIQSVRLSKRYRINLAEQREDTLAGTLSRAFTRPLANLRALRRQSRFSHDDQAPDLVWALKDVSFEIARGEVVGIIGINGAGKSTLLKVLSRITAPTSGHARVKGRLGALLEVGTGFHPDLTGRENVYLNGAILGMKMSEIDAKFDEIVEFSGVERFIDTQVKHYSSGMGLRLAFSVAAHLDPDILLIDEVLAVGDARFQEKCLGRMRTVAGEGRTVLIVSHNMSTLLRLADRAILLDNGRVICDGPAPAVVSHYLTDGGKRPHAAERHWPVTETSPDNDIVRLRSVKVVQEAAVVEDVDIRLPISVVVEYERLQNGPQVWVALHFCNDESIALFTSLDFNDQEWRASAHLPGLVRSACRIPGNFLAEGRVWVTVALSSRNPKRVYQNAPDAVSFQVLDRSAGDGARGPLAGPYSGVVRPKLEWAVTRVSTS